MAVVSGRPSSSSILAPWRWAMSLNLKHTLEAPGLQRKAEAGEPFCLYCLLLPTPYVVATGPGQAGTEPRSRTFLAILLQSQGLEMDSRILLSSSQLDSRLGNCVRACSTSMLTFCVVEAGREKLHFPDFLAVKIWVLTQVSTKGIPPKDVELGPELRERRVGQAWTATCWHGGWQPAACGAGAAFLVRRPRSLQLLGVVPGNSAKALLFQPFQRSCKPPGS